MVRVFDAKIMIEGAIHDAQSYLYQGDSKTAHKILKKKIVEIENIEKCDYAKIRW